MISPNRSAALHEHERETREFYRSLGMTDEFASRALAAAKKSLPVPRQLKPRVSPPRGFPNVFNMGQGARPMTLQEGEILCYDYNRMVVQFTMLDQSEVIQCAITTAAMDDLEKISTVKADDRVDQFLRLRAVVQERANEKHADGFIESGGRLVLRSEDFSTKL